MPLLIIIIVLLFLGVQSLRDSDTKCTRAFTEEELDDMIRQCVGRSKKECRQIVDSYARKKGR